PFTHPLGHPCRHRVAAAQPGFTHRPPQTAPPHLHQGRGRKQPARRAAAPRRVRSSAPRSGAGVTATRTDVLGGFFQYPARTAYTAASVREWTPSFSRMLRTWFFTVFSVMNRRSPIWRLFSDLARRRKTSTSRGVSSGIIGVSGGVGSCFASSANSPMSLVAMVEVMDGCPDTTARIDRESTRLNYS